jgi:hypothetical protein
MSWAGLATNQTVSFNNLQDAVTTGVFTAKTTIPVSAEQITKADANTYVNINTSFAPYAAKSSNQLVTKFDLISLGSNAFVGFTSSVTRILTVILRSGGVSISPLLTDVSSGGCSIPSISVGISPTTTTTVEAELRFRAASASDSYTGFVKAYNLSSGALVFNQTVTASIAAAGSSVFVNITGLTVGVPFYYEVIMSSDSCAPFPDPSVV